MDAVQALHEVHKTVVRGVKGDARPIDVLGAVADKLHQYDPPEEFEPLAFQYVLRLMAEDGIDVTEQSTSITAILDVMDRRKMEVFGIEEDDPRPQIEVSYR